MKRAVKVILVICLIAGLCFGAIIYYFNTVGYDHKGWFYKDVPYIEEIALDVVDCLNEGDVGKFKSLLSETVLSRQDLDEQLNVLFDFCNDYEISDEKISCDLGASSRKNGEYTYKSIQVEIDEAIVFDNESYNIDVYFVLLDDENESDIGLSKLLIRDTDKSIMMRFFENPKY